MDGSSLADDGAGDRTGGAPGRLICVSNRIPTGAEPSGGLVVALADVLARSGGVWIGAAPDTAEGPDDSLSEIAGGPFRRLAFRLTEAEHDGYYAGYSNAVLWPVVHDRADLMAYRREDRETYRAVNRRIARMVAAVLRPGDRLWIHDYHLLPLAAELRRLGVDVPIGFFLHTPFPTALALQAMPHGDEICGWLMAHDLVGLQAERDCVHARSALTRVGGIEETAEGLYAHEGRRLRVAAFPIGIDTADFARTAAEAFDRLPPGIVKPPRQLMIGVDRLDYSKGLPNRFRAFRHFLDRHEDWHRRVSLLQIAPPTREGLKAYDQIREELEGLAGKVNGAFADITWTPIRYIHRPVPRDVLAGLYRASHIALVTPLMDGMNLVAKEFVAAQDPGDPGVLILSRFAGAAEQMPEALVVNPHDEGEIAGQILTALTMPLAERRRRYAALMQDLAARDVHWWSGGFLSALDAAAGARSAG
ncbi:alpha,alpha-trehalose-phosphate synthase (UDP-forming) [Frigidibacter sp. MR17.24]|uniref:alpha,alpha-trehalose-phosphate synthase (UDP-forming) n=1 Tax=Frigidibacter sp. MR17.24 TaxID=3127345 RepID=UPI003012F2FA